MCLTLSKAEFGHLYQRSAIPRSAVFQNNIIVSAMTIDGHNQYAAVIINGMSDYAEPRAADVKFLLLPALFIRKGVWFNYYVT